MRFVPYSTPCDFVSEGAEVGAEQRDFFPFDLGKRLVGATEILETTDSLVGTEAKTIPILYEVAGPSGLLAQGAITATRHATREGTFVKDHDLTECEREHRDIRAEHGELFCEKFTSSEGGTYSFSDGWPAPPSPKARFPALTIHTAGAWSKTAVEARFRYVPPGYRARHCHLRTQGRYRCLVYWRHGPYSFTGTAEVGEANIYTGQFNYGLRIVRTNARAHQHSIVSVAY